MHVSEFCLWINVEFGKKDERNSSWGHISIVFLVHLAQVTGVISQALCSFKAGPRPPTLKRWCAEGVSKTKRRNSLAIDGTLSSIMAVSPNTNGSPQPQSSRHPRRPQPCTTNNTKPRTLACFGHTILLKATQFKLSFSYVHVIL